MLLNGNNMPLQAPLIPDPFVPYNCPANRSLNAVCQTDPSILAAYLENTPFKLNGDKFLVYVSDFTNCDKVPFMDAGIVIPVDFDGREGAIFCLSMKTMTRPLRRGVIFGGIPRSTVIFNWWITAIGLLLP
ncbi:acetoacetate decarboxylase family protein [Ochrobactrum haematophilum]|uniref:Acetoacetate decarboxylase family protein n=1 Tax=Brucella haematophila TaxID=419474 RepID=A0ABX1DU42_9HYPH|nr:acetoacetate decarboxylase family protein [Brucella haematophila]